MRKLFVTVLMVGASYIVNAQTATSGINQNQAEQKHRIHQGVKSGELTPAEASRLKAQQKRIQQDKKEAKADGVVTKQERKEIKHKQHRASKNIHHQKHDAQQMPRAK